MSADAPYRGFAADRALMRQTYTFSAKETKSKPLRASSGEAVGAARRVFERTPLLFRTRAEILELLGDPSEISDYNKPAAAGDDQPLEYVFDTGFNGFRVTFTFEQDGAVKSITVDRIS